MEGGASWLGAGVKELESLLKAEGFARRSNSEIAHSLSQGTVTGLLRGTGTVLTLQLWLWSNFPHILRKSPPTPELPSYQSHVTSSY